MSDVSQPPLGTVEKQAEEVGGGGDKVSVRPRAVLNAKMLAKSAQHLQTHFSDFFLLVTRRTLPPCRKIGMATQTTLGVDRGSFGIVVAGLFKSGL